MKSYKEIVNSFDTGTRELSDSELAHLKEVMLNCFLDFKRICEANNLTIMLGGESALGAVRHKGYIPWDDDFDVLMPRQDYEVLKKIFPSCLGDKYTLDAPNYSEECSNRFPKILINGTKFVEVGADPNKEYNKIKIDIFILENMPSNTVIRLFKGLVCTVYMYISYICLSHGTFLYDGITYKFRFGV